MGSELVTPDHLRRHAVVYVRQSTPHQVLSNQESLRLQYALRDRAREFGWHEADIHVIDADLGISAAAADQRQGFKDLVARVTLGEVGIILSIDVTRLARNCSDWYPLLDVCGHRQCLIADRDGVYDPGTPNGRLLLGLKGTISELELHTIRSRLTTGLLAKAERGDLALSLPIGLVRDPSGVVVKTPDREVQARIELVFDTFMKRRTAVKVVRTLHERGLSLPRHDRDGQACWKRPTIPAVIAMLKNPAYAGAFVYGRTRMGPTKRRPGGWTKRKLQADEGWKVVVKDKYPAFIDWETFELIQAMLRDNRAEYLRNKTRGIPRDGAALLHGITWCGECGHKMVVRYKGGSQYVCNHLRQQHDMPVCQTLRAAAIDRAVGEAFRAAVAPAEIDAWKRARKAQRQADEALDRAEGQQVERLRYEAHLAERQFNRVDPDNRLVAAELERRWEAALLAVRRAEEALSARKNTRSAGPDRLDPKLHAKVVAIGRRLPELWADPAVSREHRKALLRCLIEKVVMRRIARDAANVRIVWRGGETTEITVALPINATTALPRYAEMEARVLDLARAGRNDTEIAELLTAEGYRSPSRPDAVLPATVQKIRLCHRLKLQPKRTRWAKIPGWLSVPEVALRLGVSSNWVSKRIYRGTIRINRDQATGRFLFPEAEPTILALRQLQSGAVRKIDLRENELD
jgi:DNA invertase Pin-like site-specific DNA recombinase